MNYGKLTIEHDQDPNTGEIGGVYEGDYRSYANPDEPAELVTTFIYNGPTTEDTASITEVNSNLAIFIGVGEDGTRVITRGKINEVYAAAVIQLATELAADLSKDYTGAVELLAEGIVLVADEITKNETGGILQ